LAYTLAEKFLSLDLDSEGHAWAGQHLERA